MHLIADMERLGMVRRVKLSRFSQVETKNLLEQEIRLREDVADCVVVDLLDLARLAVDLELGRREANQRLPRGRPCR